MTARLRNISTAIEIIESEGISADQLKALRDSLTPQFTEDTLLGEAVDTYALEEADDAADRGEALRKMLLENGFTVTSEHRTDLVPGVAQLMERHPTGHPQLTLEHWRRQVAADATQSGYWDWVRLCLVDSAKETERAESGAGA